MTWPDTPRDAYYEKIKRRQQKYASNGRPLCKICGRPAVADTVSIGWLCYEHGFDYIYDRPFKRQSSISDKLRRAMR